MGMIGFFKIPKPRQFNYKPVFYDADKEELKEREQVIKQELGLADENDPRVSIRNRIRREYSRKRNVGTSRKSSLRLIIIIMILMGIAYYILH
ncbi:MAG: hypothetical protein JW783_00735 [Bacteroidales bacterium]|nr:hypothetical protein [Bacteroidales bacterium]MBN2749637.1 hypothetical protein [Bacteroidales bacterium]